jgi:hypothetical protein
MTDRSNNGAAPSKSSGIRLSRHSFPIRLVLDMFFIVMDIPFYCGYHIVVPYDYRRVSRKNQLPDDFYKIIAPNMQSRRNDES